MSMKIVLANSVELTPESASSTNVTHQGANRSALQFTFSEKNETFPHLQELFTESNCETITIVDDTMNPDAPTKTVKTGYIMLVGISTESRIIKPGDEENEPVYGKFYVVTVASRTYQENQLKALQDSTDQALLIALGVI